MKKLIDILIILLTAMMIVAAACMIFSCRSHRDVMQEKETIVKTEISEESSIAEVIKQHAHEHEQKKMSFEWVLNYSMLSEPDSAGRQHPTQTGTLTGKAESASSKDSSEEHERDIKESATKKEDRQQHESYAERVRVEKASATPISLITLAIGLIITAVCVKWIVFKKGSKPWKR